MTELTPRKLRDIALQVNKEKERREGLELAKRLRIQEEVDNKEAQRLIKELSGPGGKIVRAAKNGQHQADILSIQHVLWDASMEKTTPHPNSLPTIPRVLFKYFKSKGFKVYFRKHEQDPDGDFDFIGGVMTISWKE